MNPYVLILIGGLFSWIVVTAICYVSYCAAFVRAWRSFAMVEGTDVPIDVWKRAHRDLMQKVLGRERE